MIHTQNMKVIPLVLSTAATNATASAQGSVVGFRYAVIKANLPKATGTDSAAIWTALKVQGGDSATGAWTDIMSGTSGTPTSTQFALATHGNTSNPQQTKIFVDLLKFPYSNLNVVYNPPASHATIEVEIELSRAEQTPNSASEMGVGAFGIA